MADLPKRPGPVRRLTVSWRGGEWRVENERRIDRMTLMRSDELPRVDSKQGLAGFWWEVVDDTGKVIYRQIGNNPFTGGQEVVKRDGTLTHTGAAGEDELFDIVFPDIPQVAALHFYSDATPAPQKIMSRPEGPARRIAEIDVRSKRGGGRGHR